MKALKNNRGIALLMVLVLSLISLAMTAGLLYLVTKGTQTSGTHKRYKTALEACLGAIDVSADLVRTRGDATKITAFKSRWSSVSPLITTPTGATGCVPDDTKTECTSLGDYEAGYEGIETKFKLPTECWDNCDSDTVIDTSDSDTYDMSMLLGSDPVYKVAVKFFETTYGNSGLPPTGLVKTGVVINNKNEQLTAHINYLYSMELLCQALNNPRERTKTFVLYGY